MRAKRSPTRVIAFAAFLGFSATTSSFAQAPKVPAVHLAPHGDRLRVELNGKLFTEYYYTNVPRPFCYPLLGPTGVPMTRHFPMTNAPGEQHDHPHHRSLWFAHSPVNGFDLWTERTNAGRIAHRGLAEITSGNEVGVLTTLNDWLAPDGKVLCSDEQTLRFYPPKDKAITLDFEITLRASRGDVTFGDSKEGSFALRIAESMRLVQPETKGEAPRPGAGRIVLSTGESDDGASAVAARIAKRETNTWGKRAAWCDYSGPVDGKIVGIAVLDHPGNPRHPTWWHVRDYGLLAANPFGQHDFENGTNRRAGELTIPSGQSVKFRYRVILHEGDEKKAHIAERFNDYVKSTSINPK
jgi:hypothetical protein